MTPAATHRVRLLHAAKQYGDRHAVGPLSVSVAAGEFVALLGPSGCGKSTLLRLVAGLDRPTDGVVEVDTTQRAFVFQDAHLLPWRTVMNNVTLPLELQKTRGTDGPPTPRGRNARAASAVEALRRVGLGDDTFGLYPAQLSGGMRMRVSLARALVTRPSLLLLDEPFAALDEIVRQQLDDVLRALWSGGGLTVLFVTHSVHEAAYLADRVVVLSPRPARVVLDTPIRLPRDRAVLMRTTTEFAAEARRLFDALAAEVPA